MLVAAEGLLVMMALKCGQRALSMASLAFGLVATGGLALAVATDFWLYTSEPILIPDSVLATGPGPDDYYPLNDTYVDEYPVNEGGIPGLFEPPTFTVQTNSGLWRACIIYGNMIGAGEWAYRGKSGQPRVN